MNAFAKILTILVFIGFGLSLYSGSKAGWGISGLRDQGNNGSNQKKLSGILSK